VAAGTIALILALRRYRPTWPGFLIAVVAASAAVSLAHLPVETIGSRFGGIPNALPLPQLPTITAERILEVLPDALAFALLGGIESLLSAVVADAMGGTRHRSNMELVAQGVANVGCAFFGGICATGTIARTATNVRSGAFSPVAGMLHAAFLLAFMLFAAPLASYIPLAALAGILAVVAWNMAERHEFWSILRRSRGEAAVLLATFLTTLLRDLTEGIVVGVVLGSFLFMHRMAELVSVETGTPLLSEDGPDDADVAPVGPGDGTVAVFRITGPLFFGASTKIATTLDRIGRFPKIAILDLSAVPLADSSAAASLKEFVARGRNNGAQVFVAGANPVVRRALEREHLGLPAVAFAPTIADARMAAQLDTSSMEASRS
jgi:SulP family sulfate permease